MNQPLENIKEIEIKIQDLYQNYEYLKQELTMPVVIKNHDLQIKNVKSRFLHITSLTYIKDYPRLEAFENIVASIRKPNCRLAYYLRGTEHGVEFYVGVVDNGNAENGFDLTDYVQALEQAFKGNFVGTQFEFDHNQKEKRKEQSTALVEELRSEDMHYSVVMGIPSKNKEKDTISFQGVERLVNIMNGTPFHMLVLWEPVEQKNLEHFDQKIKHIAGEVETYAKYSEQFGISSSSQHGKSTNDSTTQNDSSTKGKNTGKSENTGWNKGENDSCSSSSESGGSSKTWGDSSSKTHGTSKTKGSGTSESKTEGRSKSITLQRQNKFLSEIAKYIDDELLPRVRQGIAKGMYETTVYLGAKFPADLTLLENAIISIYQGDKSTFFPLHARRLPQTQEVRDMVSSFSICRGLEAQSELLPLSSRNIYNYRCDLSTLLTSSEVSILAGMPQKEVPGLELREQVDFGLNIPATNEDNSLKLGTIYHEGTLLKKREVFLDKKELSKHIFIAGTTGSGKTTTCHKLLFESQMPFMVIEPAKTEYRALLNDKKLGDILIFTVGNERGVPFRFNPFEFLPEESLSGHVDQLKACFMASFDMDAAIPNLLEEALYKTYEVFGWDFRDDSNRFLQNREEAWNCGGKYFPIISDYIDVIVSVIESKGFDTRMRDDYMGSIRARLDSLRTGVKKLMFDTRLSVDFNDLLNRKVILELEDLKSGEDKSFLMGLVLGRLVEALKARHAKDPNYRHITLMEESHRLLTKIMPGDSPNRKMGVEAFSDMLAEVRKYGESLIIVDQIPSKLASETLKNTNTKIIHKLFARDDKSAVGDTMALNDKQKDYLSNLLPGEAIVFSQGWKKPVDMQVEQLEHVRTDVPEVSPKLVTKIGWQYWLEYPELFCADFPKNQNLNSLTREKLQKLTVLRERCLEWLTKDVGIQGEGTADEISERKVSLLLAAKKELLAEFEPDFAKAFLEKTLELYIYRVQLRKYSGTFDDKTEIESVMQDLPEVIDAYLEVKNEKQAKDVVKKFMNFIK